MSEELKVLTVAAAIAFGVFGIWSALRDKARIEFERTSQRWGGEFQIVRTETRAGEVNFNIQHWRPSGWFDSNALGGGPFKRNHPTFEAAEAAIETWVRERRDQQIISRKAVSRLPAKPPPTSEQSPSTETVRGEQ